MRFKSRDEFLTSAGMFEFSLLLVAMALGWLFSVSPTEHVAATPMATAYGVLAAFPLFLVFLGVEQIPVKPIQKIQETRKIHKIHKVHEIQKIRKINIC